MAKKSTDRTKKRARRGAHSAAAAARTKGKPGRSERGPDPAPLSPSDEATAKEGSASPVETTPWFQDPTYMLALGTLVFANTLFATFVYDDLWTIVSNPFIKDLSNLPALITGRFPPDLVSGGMEVDLVWRPFMVFTTFVDYAIFGMRAYGWHAQNVLWHIACTWGVFSLARRLSADHFVAMAAGTIFTTHAIHTEVVASVNYREDLLVTFGVLAALNGVLHYRETGALRWLVLGCLGLILGTNSKATAVTAPVLLVIHDLCFERRVIQALRTRFWQYGIVGLASIFSRRWLGVLSGGSDVGYHDMDLPTLDPLVMLFTQAKIWLAYLGQMVLPVGLNADYVTPPAETLADPAVIAGLILVVGLLVVGVTQARRRPMVGFGIAWFVLTLLPTSGIVPVPNLRADRYLYIASVGFCLVAGWLLREAFVRASARWPQSRFSHRNAPWVALGLLCVIYGGLSVARNFVWMNEVRLWESTAEASPESIRAQAGLMSAYQRQERWEDALAVGERALELAPDDHRLRMNYGIVLSALGRHEEGIAQLEMARDLGAGGEPVVFNNLGHALHRAGRSEDGVAVLQRAIQQWPSHARLHYNLGLIYFETDRYAEAIGPLETSLRLIPHNAAAMRMLATCYLRTGRVDAAQETAEAALRRRPDDPETQALLEEIQSAR